MEKTIVDLLDTPIDDVEDAIAKLYVNVKYNKNFNPYEKLDLYDIFFLVQNHKDKSKIQLIFSRFFLDYMKEMKEAMEEIVLDADGGYRFNIYNHKFATELLDLALFYNGKNIEEAELEEISESYDDPYSYLKENFWANVLCDMKMALSEIAN